MELSPAVAAALPAVESLVKKCLAQFAADRVEK
jgi:hypothetical protein